MFRGGRSAFSVVPANKVPKKDGLFFLFFFHIHPRQNAKLDKYPCKVCLYVYIFKNNKFKSIREEELSSYVFKGTESLALVSFWHLDED